MSRKVVNEDGLRIAGVKIANEGAVISDEFYNAHAAANGWEDRTEKVGDDAKSESKPDTTPDRQVGTGNQVDMTVADAPKPPSAPSAPKP